MRDFIYAIKSGFWVVAIILASLPTGCQQEAFDTEKYESYRLYDKFLVCLDSESEASTSVEYAGKEYHVTFYKVKGVSDDQFIYANIDESIPLAPSHWCVLQNPDNYVDVWSEWTVKEIQICTSDTILATTTSQLCAQDLSLLNRTEPVKLPDTPSKYLTTLSIRVIFEESESIIWVSHVEYRQNTETGEMMVCVATDATQWDGIYAPNGELIEGIYFDYDRNWLADSPYLEEFLLDARETYLETK